MDHEIKFSKHISYKLHVINLQSLPIIQITSDIFDKLFSAQRIQFL